MHHNVRCQARTNSTEEEEEEDEEEEGILSVRWWQHTQGKQTQNDTWIVIE